MNIFLNQWKQRSLFVGAILLVGFVIEVGAAPPKAAPKVAEATVAVTNVVIPESVFEDELKTGKDPFFPKSTRRFAQISAPGVTTAPVVPTASQLTLQGISGTAKNRFAIINRQTFAPGEKALVKISSGSVSIRCVEIRERSVLITIEGDPEPKELHLRPF